MSDLETETKVSIIKAFINFTYKSPIEDIGDSIEIKSDGTINSLSTLTNMKQILEKNLNILETLHSFHNDIHSIDIIGYDNIQIEINTDIANKLKQQNIITYSTDDFDLDQNSHTISNSDDSDIELFNEISDDSNTETNQDRYNMIKKLVEPNNIRNLLEQDITLSDSNSESESDNDDIICDDNNIRALISKYYNIINSCNNCNDCHCNHCGNNSDADSANNTDSDNDKTNKLSSDNESDISNSL